MRSAQASLHRKCGFRTRTRLLGGLRDFAQVAAANAFAASAWAPTVQERLFKALSVRSVTRAAGLPHSALSHKATAPFVALFEGAALGEPSAGSAGHYQGQCRRGP